MINALEAYVYATILTEGVAGTSPIGLITGEGNLEEVSVHDAGLGASSMVVQGAGQISLADMMQSPGLAIATMSSNFQNNLAPMALAAFATSITFRIGKRLLRKPINNINRNIMKPALGAGIKL